MSGQLGFQATDPIPPMTGPTFDAEDIKEHGLPLLLTVWERVVLTSQSETFDLSLIEEGE